MEEGASVPMSEDLVLEFKNSEQCPDRTDDGRLVFAGQGKEIKLANGETITGDATVFTVSPDGDVSAFKNMDAERLWLDFCQ